MTQNQFRPFKVFLTKKVSGTGARALVVMSICLIVGSIFIVQGASQAFATQAVPQIQKKVATDLSFYMNSSNTGEASTLGKNQANADKTNRTSSLVILDFGAQASNGSGTDYPGSTHFISNGQIEKVVEAFASGYVSHAGSGRFVTVAIGTNNSGANVGTANGKTWGHLVSAVKSYVASHHYNSHVIIAGGDDIESWGSPGAAINWVNGYHSVGNIYYNFGSADGCPENSSNNTIHCAGNWTQYDYWYVSWGNPSAFSTPEIYNQTGAQAQQWAMISLYSVQHHSGPIVFMGPMDQHNIQPGCCTGTNNTATQAWDQLWNALHARKSTAQNLFYSLEIRHE